MCLGPKVGQTDRHVGRWDMRTEIGPLPTRAPLRDPSLYYRHAPSMKHRLGHRLRLELAAWKRIARCLVRSLPGSGLVVAPIVLRDEIGLQR